MEYNFREKVEQLLERERRTKKSLYDALGMSMQGFDAMMKNNSFSGVRLAKIAEFFGISISDLYGQNSPKSEIVLQYSDQRIDRIAGDVSELRHAYEEQFRGMQRTIESLNRTIEVLVGKSEGDTMEPLSTEVFDMKRRGYSKRALSHALTAKAPSRSRQVAKLVAPR